MLIYTPTTKLIIIFLTKSTLCVFFILLRKVDDGFSIRKELQISFVVTTSQIIIGAAFPLIFPDSDILLLSFMHFSEGKEVRKKGERERKEGRKKERKKGEERSEKERRE
jgi:hypothetical protein